MRRAILLTACLYVAVAAVEIVLHWYAGTQDTTFAHSLKEWYLSRDPHNDKPYDAGLCDHIIPAIIVGLGMGGFTASRPLREMLVGAFILPIGVVALFPIYAGLLPTKDWDTYWNFASYWERSIAFIPAYIKEVLLCAVFGYAGRLSVCEWMPPRRRANDSH